MLLGFISYSLKQTARKRTRKGHGNPVSLDGLSHREDVEDFIRITIEANGGELVEQVGITKWQRRICWYAAKKEADTSERER